MDRYHVLVAYGSKNGSTAEIAEWIGEALHTAGLDAQVKPADEVRDLTGQDAVVLGGALYANRWHRDAARFARRHREELATRPVWLFSSGPLDSTANVRDIPPVREVDRIAARVNARGHVTFGGSLREGAKGWIAKRMLKSGHGGDFRDPERVRVWARGLASEITAEFVA